MNIFALEVDPYACAWGLDDKRVGKLLMEAAQLLTYAVRYQHEFDLTPDNFGDSKLCGDPNRYPTKGYVNGPIAQWVRSNSERYEWTLSYAVGLWDEFHYRFDKWHASGYRIAYIQENFENCLPDGPLLPFQNSARHNDLGIDCTDVAAPESYRQYIQQRWDTDKNPVVFTRRAVPEWSLPLCV